MRSMFVALGEHYSSMFPLPLLNQYKKNTVNQPLYDQEYGFACLGLVRTIHNAEFHTDPDVATCLAALLLRMPHAPETKYELEETIKLLKSNNLDERDFFLYEEQMKGAVPTANGSRSIHDAEILTLLTACPDQLIAFVRQATGQTHEAAIRNIILVTKTQTMYTVVGRSMIDAIAPNLRQILETTIV